MQNNLFFFIIQYFIIHNHFGIILISILLFFFIVNTVFFIILIFKLDKSENYKKFISILEKNSELNDILKDGFNKIVDLNNLKKESQTTEQQKTEQQTTEQQTTEQQTTKQFIYTPVEKTKTFLENVIDDYNSAYKKYYIDKDFAVINTFLSKYPSIYKFGILDILNVRNEHSLSDVSNFKMGPTSDGYLLLIKNIGAKNLEYVLLPDFRFTKDMIINTGINKAYKIIEDNSVPGIRIIEPALYDSNYNLLSNGIINIKYS
jgi:hypothetical protein